MYTSLESYVTKFMLRQFGAVVMFSFDRKTEVVFRTGDVTEARARILMSLSARVFETRTATGSELFSLLTYLHTTEFALPSIFSPLEMLGIKIWETPLSWHAKCPLPIVVRVLKTCVLTLPKLSNLALAYCINYFSAAF